MIISDSSEKYLETILILEKQIGNVRSIDIVNKLDFSKPSISVAMKKLRSNGYIRVEKSGYIKLTDSGRDIAEKVYEKHLLFSLWLKQLGVDDKTAEEDACKLEHVISDISFEAIKRTLFEKSLAKTFISGIEK